MRRGVSLAEICKHFVEIAIDNADARVVESWLVGLPSVTRDYARARILALNDSNSGYLSPDLYRVLLKRTAVLRAVRYAVAAAYIFLFASDPTGGHHSMLGRDSRPKLVELACMGAGVSEGAADGKQTQNGTTESTANAFRKIRLYVDHVSTPFAADLESTMWTEDAVQELRTVCLTDKSQLSDMLWGVIDLQLVEVS
jgi:hypothetical protein